MEATAPNLRYFGKVRMEELDGFVDGLFAGEDEVDLPERAHVGGHRNGCSLNCAS